MKTPNLFAMALLQGFATLVTPTRGRTPPIAAQKHRSVHDHVEAVEAAEAKRARRAAKRLKAVR